MKKDILAEAKWQIKECQNIQFPYLRLESFGITNLKMLPELFKCKHIKSLMLGNNEWHNYFEMWDDFDWDDINWDYSSYGEDNSISFIPEEISNLTKLQHLDLCGNKISDISFLAKLPELQSLDIKNNQLKKLPKFIFQRNMEINMDKDAKKGLCLYGNPIESPPLEIIKQGKEAVLRHFERIEKEGGKDKLEYIYEAKLILVGKGNAGKTSLQKKLIDENALLPESDKRTRGIEVVDFEFEKGKIAHIWDFGGQVVYYPVHRFFITKNAVFVLLASTREYEHNFEYWIPTIYQFGGQSPIIIGQTCHEGLTIPWNNFGVNLNNLNYNIIKTSPKSYIEIDLTDAGKNRGLKEIKEDIITQIKKLPHFGRGVPKSWAKVRNALLEKSQSVSYISFETFVNLCRQLEPVFLNEIEDITDCCQFFHDIGVLLWYSEIEELKNLVILKPEWAMNAVYKIIDNIHNGLIHKNDFDTLWDSDTYKDKHDILKKILERFKIAFPTRYSRNQTYIFPAKLSSMSLEKKWKLEVLKEKFLRLEYKFEFMPKGIVNQISAELSEYILDRDVWNDAVSIIHEISEAQIIEDTNNKKISIISKGVDARGMNIRIMEAIKNIIGEYQGVEAEILVPCTCNSCRQSKKPTFFPYDRLLEWSFKGRQEVTCNESGENLPIFGLLYNAGFDQSKIIIENTISEELKEMKEIKHNTQKILSKQDVILTKLESHYEDLMQRLCNIVTKEDIQKAMDEINAKQTEEITVSIMNWITYVFEEFEAEMEDKLKDIYNDLKKTKDLQSKLKLSIPFIKQLGIDLGIEFDVKNWASRMYKKYELKIFKLMGAV